MTVERSDAAVRRRRLGGRLRRTRGTRLLTAVDRQGEERDGAQFHMDRTSPFGAPKLVRTPGLRKVEPDAVAPPV